MNPFEAYNLNRLAENLEAAKHIKAAKVSEIMDKEARHMVYILFEQHQGDLDKIKAALQAEAETLKALSLQDVVNKEYLRHKAKAHIYNPEAHRTFAKVIWKCEKAHQLVTGLLRKRRGNIAAAKKNLIQYTTEIKDYDLAENVRREWSRQIKQQS